MNDFSPFATNGFEQILYDLDRLNAAMIGAFTCLELYGDMTAIWR